VACYAYGITAVQSLPEENNATPAQMQKIITRKNPVIFENIGLVEAATNQKEERKSTDYYLWRIGRATTHSRFSNHLQSRFLPRLQLTQHFLSS